MQPASHDDKKVVDFPAGNVAASLTVAGTTVSLRPDGRLEHLEQWTPEVAEALAEKDGLQLSDAHWLVINAMRGFYQEYNVSPVRKLLKRALVAQDKELADDSRIDVLFPHGLLVQGSRIAGIPMPHLDVELDRTYNSAAVPPQRDGVNPAHFVESFEFEGRTFKVTPIGNLVDLHLWNEHLAEFMAEKEGIQLTPDHWEVLNFLRQFYFEYGITPMVKILMKHIATEVHPDKAKRDYLYGLFPNGPSRQGSRIAGLPEPQGCIDG